MAECDSCPAYQEKDKAPGEEVRSYEQKAGCDEKKEEGGGG